MQSSHITLISTIMNRETVFSSLSGYVMPLVLLSIAGACAGAFLWGAEAIAIGLALVAMLLFKGFFLVNPNDSCFLILFGRYSGTFKENGFFWANPFFVRQRISMRAHNFDSERLKVNDQLGNPILISVILVWRVKYTFRAAFEVDYYEKFVQVQADAAVRKLASKYPYDNFEDELFSPDKKTGVRPRDYDPKILLEARGILEPKNWKKKSAIEKRITRPSTRWSERLHTCGNVIKMNIVRQISKICSKRLKTTIKSM